MFICFTLENRWCENFLFYKMASTKLTWFKDDTNWNRGKKRYCLKVLQPWNVDGSGLVWLIAEHFNYRIWMSSSRSKLKFYIIVLGNFISKLQMPFWYLSIMLVPCGTYWRKKPQQNRIQSNFCREPVLIGVFQINCTH